MRKQEGMTLIGLLITIVVVLILGAITIGLALGNHGLLNANTYEEYNQKVEQREEMEKATNNQDSTTEENSQPETAEPSTPEEANTSTSNEGAE